VTDPKPLHPPTRTLLVARALSRGQAYLRLEHSADRPGPLRACLSLSGGGLE